MQSLLRSSLARVRDFEAMTPPTDRTLRRDRLHEGREVSLQLLDRDGLFDAHRIERVDAGGHHEVRTEPFGVELRFAREVGLEDRSARCQLGAHDSLPIMLAMVFWMCART